MNILLPSTELEPDDEEKEHSTRRGSMLSFAAEADSATSTAAADIFMKLHLR